jgi:surface protein
MSAMFQAAKAFNQDISSWNVSRVTHMKRMFSDATLFNQNIGLWDVSKVTDMTFMFASNSSAFNQNLGPWGTKFNTAVNLTNFLDNAGMNASNYDATLAGLNDGIVTGRSMGAINLKYNCSAVADRANLIKSVIDGGKGWTITGDIALTCTSLSLNSDKNPAEVGDNITLTATLSSTTATGTIIFKDGSTVLGTATVIDGIATLSTTALTTVGTSLITAEYSGGWHILFK